VVSKLPRNSTQKNLKKAWAVSYINLDLYDKCNSRFNKYLSLKEQNILENWQKTSWAKKLSYKKVRASLNDFDRFKVMVAKKQKAKIVGDKLASM
jgi:ribosomal protein L14E/L6E/L27E